MDNPWCFRPQKALLLQKCVPGFHAVYYERFSESFGKECLMVEYLCLYVSRRAAQSVESGLTYRYHPRVGGKLVEKFYPIL